MTITAAKKTGAVADVRRAEALHEELVKLLESLGKSEKISTETRNALANAGWNLGRSDVEKVFERALDELDAVPRTRVDTDRLAVSHGTVVCFDLLPSYKARGQQPEKQGRTTTDDFHLIQRFMKSHPRIKLSTHRVPFGGPGDHFEIRGTKAAREKFKNDPRWPKLQNALDDIYWTDHAPGYSDEIAKRRRKIADPEAYVFGSR